MHPGSYEEQEAWEQFAKEKELKKEKEDNMKKSKLTQEQKDTYCKTVQRKVNEVHERLQKKFKEVQTLCENGNTMESKGD